MSDQTQSIYQEEKLLKAQSGFLYLFALLLTTVLSIALIVFSGMQESLPLLFVGLLLLLASLIAMAGLRIVKPNEARAFTLFGDFCGVIKKPGFYYIHPFSTSIRPQSDGESSKLDLSDGKAAVNSLSGMPSPSVSLKTQTLLNNRQKINDELGNPIEIGIAVVWRIANVTKALLNIDNYKEYLSVQCDAALRDIVRSYPYDLAENDDNERTLRGSSTEIAKHLAKEIQSKLDFAGLEILEARITHLAYAPEIAAAMLQRQQASAIVDARQMIVEGAVGMVDIALKMLKDEDIVDLDPERKAQMVSNLLVVLCANKDAQPVVNSGSLY